jgi:hypothetical protein
MIIYRCTGKFNYYRSCLLYLSEVVHFLNEPEFSSNVEHCFSSYQF